MSAYDFVKMSSFKKKYLLQAEEIPKIKGLLKKHQKKFLVASSAYALEVDQNLRNHLLLKFPQKDSAYLHDLWFDYLKNNYPDNKFCGMFEKLKP